MFFFGGGIKGVKCISEEKYFLKMLKMANFCHFFPWGGGKQKGIEPSTGEANAPHDPLGTATDLT